MKGFLLIFLSVWFCSTLWSEGKRSQVLEKAFATHPFYQGGDGIYSIPLGPGRLLWLFGDTFLDPSGSSARKGSYFINNSLAILAYRENPLEINSLNFYWGGEKSGQNLKAFFTPPNGGKNWLWPLHGIRSGKNLYLFFLEIEKTKEGDPFGFRTAKNRMGLVSNPDQIPGKWLLKWFDLPGSGGNSNFYWGSSVFILGDYFYIYGFKQENHSPQKSLIVARSLYSLPLSQFSNWEYLSRSGRWQKNPLESHEMVGEMAPEFSVHYDPGIKRILLLYTHQGFSPDILFRIATNPEGPFGPSHLLYKAPEFGAKGGNVFTYAAKAHPIFLTKPGKIFFSYVTNSFKGDDILEDKKFYLPLFKESYLKILNKD